MASAAAPRLPRTRTTMARGARTVMMRARMSTCTAAMATEAPIRATAGAFLVWSEDPPTSWRAPSLAYDAKLLSLRLSGKERRFRMPLLPQIPERRREEEEKEIEDRSDQRSREREKERRERRREEREVRRGGEERRGHGSVWVLT